MSNKNSKEILKSLKINKNTNVFIRIENNHIWSEYESLFNTTTQNLILSTLEKSEQDKVCISLFLTDDVQMQEINFKWRNIEKPTNVLSFPNVNKFRENGRLNLGDIVISYNAVYNEAKERKIHFIDHFRHLLVHGILHLNGFEHDNVKSMSVMENLEIEILSNYGISNPYL